MKRLLSGIIGLCALSVSCSKDDDNFSSGGPQVNTPDLGLVAGADFKNTAKNGSEVGQKLNTAATVAESTKISNASNKSKSDSEGSLIQSLAVTSFLTGSHSQSGSSSVDAPKPAFKLSMHSREGEYCGSDLDQLNGIYTSGAKGLREVANSLTKFDSQLPEGFVKSGPTDKFAVIYTVDLSKVQFSESTSSQDARPDAKTTGALMIGAGANAEAAVVGFGINARSTQDKNVAAVTGEFAASVNTVAENLKFSTKGTLNANAVDERGSQHNINAQVESLFTIQAGIKPGISVSLKGSSNVLPNQETGNLTLSDEGSTIDLSASITKVSDSEVLVSYNFVENGKAESKKWTYVVDEFDNCTVRPENIIK